MNAHELVDLFNREGKGIVVSEVRPDGHSIRMVVGPDHWSEMSLRDNAPDTIIGEWETLMSMETRQDWHLRVPA